MGIFSITKNLFNGKKKRTETAYALITMALVNDGKYETEDVYYVAMEKFVQENGGKIINQNSSYIIIDEDRIDFFNPYDDAVEITIVNNEEYTNDVLDKLSGQGKYTKKEDDRKQNGFNHVLGAIKVLNETNAEILRLEFKNIGEALTALWDMDIKTINVEGVDHFIIDNKVYGMYVSQDRYIDITDFSDEDNIRTPEWMDEQKIIIEKRNAKIEIMRKDTNSLEDDKDMENLNLESEQLNDKSKVRTPLSPEEMYQKYSRKELNNHAKTVSFLKKNSNAINADGKGISKSPEEKLSIALKEYEKLNDKIVNALKFVDLIKLLDLYLSKDNEIYEYKDWLINEYYPESKRVHNQIKSYGKYDEVNELFEKLLASLVTKIISIDEADKDYKYITDRKHIINRLNQAELDYEDMFNAHQEIVEDNYLLRIEMMNEENFSLIFETANDLKIATELVYFKLDVAVSELAEQMNKYYEKIGLGKLLLDCKKMIFSEFIDQYELTSEEMDSAYKWQEKNNESDRQEKMIDFRGYSLNFLNDETGPVAIIVAQSEDEIRQQTLQEEIDEIPF